MVVDRRQKAGGGKCGGSGQVPGRPGLETVFQLLSDQLRSQYILTYKSFAAPGAHTLAVNVNHLGSQDSDTRNFLLPALPARVNFLSPIDGESVGDMMKVVATISGGSETIERVDFEVNGEVIGSDNTTPYELEIDMTSYAEGNVSVTATAYGMNNTKLASSSINLIHAIPTVVPPTATLEPVPTPVPTKEPKGDNTIVIVGSVLGGLGFITIILLAFILSRQKKQEKTEVDERTQPQSYGSPVPRGRDDDRTMDSYGGGSEWSL